MNDNRHLAAKRRAARERGIIIGGGACIVAPLAAVIGFSSFFEAYPFAGALLVASHLAALCWAPQRLADWLERRVR